MCPLYFEMEITKNASWTDVSGIKERRTSDIYSRTLRKRKLSRINYKRDMQLSAMFSDVQVLFIFI